MSPAFQYFRQNLEKLYRKTHYIKVVTFLDNLVIVRFLSKSPELQSFRHSLFESFILSISFSHKQFSFSFDHLEKLEALLSPKLEKKPGSAAKNDQSLF